MKRGLGESEDQKQGRRLPAFRDDAEERKFWETHEPGDYVGRTRPAQVQVSRKVSERVKARHAEALPLSCGIP